MNRDSAIEAQGLTKRYDEEVLAVDGVDLAIATNSIYALLGPNGAGKTTTVSMLTTLVAPTGGSAKVAGFDVVEQAADVRAHIGVTFQEIVLDRSALDGGVAHDERPYRERQSAADRDALPVSIPAPLGQTKADLGLPIRSTKRIHPYN